MVERGGEGEGGRLNWSFGEEEGMVDGIGGI